MKYRIQFKAVFNNDNSNTILNQIELLKIKVFSPIEYTKVDIIRSAIKQEYLEDSDNPTQYISVDFDAGEVTHSIDNGQTEYEMDLDISFDVQQDFLDCINYLESIKNLADNTKRRGCRHFECMHDEIPLPNDGSYTYMDFDGVQLTYPL